eukprot:5233794-Alexandrium_andersonii.AAC.1
MLHTRPSEDSGNALSPEKRKARGLTRLTKGRARSMNFHARLRGAVIVSNAGRPCPRRCSNCQLVASAQ